MPTPRLISGGIVATEDATLWIGHGRVSKTSLQCAWSHAMWRLGTIVVDAERAALSGQRGASGQPTVQLDQRLRLEAVGLLEAVDRGGWGSPGEA